MAPIVERAGFETIDWYSVLYEEPVAAAGRVESRRRITRRHSTIIGSLTRDNGVAATLLKSPPDLLLVDVAQPHLAVWAAARGLGVVMLATSLPQARHGNVPLLRSEHALPRTRREAVSVRWAWRQHLLRRRATAWLADRIGACPPYELLRRMARDPWSRRQRRDR